MELVHDDETDVGRAALSQSEVREDLGGAADDRGVGVDRRVAGDHADVVGAELLAEREELLGDERLDGCRVEGDAVVGEGGEVGGRRDERLPRTGRRRQDEVAPAEDLEERLLLVRVEGQARARSSTR